MNSRNNGLRSICIIRFVNTGKAKCRRRIIVERSRFVNDIFYIGNSDLTAFWGKHCISIMGFYDNEIKIFPHEVEEKELIKWAETFEYGYRHGKKDGIESGKAQLQRDLMKLLGITDAINWLAEIVNNIPKR
jgi:hypothetical protein